jgi:cell division septation protein DedD
MSYLHDEIDDDQPEHLTHRSQGRELTLSTGTILGIFFGLALLCALFFGFGYNMGSKTHQAPIVNAEGPPSPRTSADFTSFKPAAGAPASSTPKSSAVNPQPETVTIAPTPTQPAPIVRTPAAPPPTAPARPTEVPAATRATPATEAGLTFTVQVAAVSHQEDADLLVAALKRKGYAVVSRTEPQDKLFHIQVGPFASKKDADAMRQHLAGDGYNAIVK